MTIDGAIQGVWTIVLHETGNFNDKGKSMAETQFDATTGKLLLYHGPRFPAAKIKTQDEAYYKQKLKELATKVLGTEYVKQYDETVKISISKPDGNRYKSELGSAVFRYKREQIQLSVDSDGCFERFMRFRLPDHIK